MRKVIGTVAMLAAGAVIGIIAFIAVIFKMAGKVARIVEVPEIVVSTVKDFIVKMVSKLLYADSDALVRNGRSYGSRIRYTTYYAADYRSSYKKLLFTFDNRDDALEFTDKVSEEYQENGPISVSCVKDIYNTLNTLHNRSGIQSIRYTDYVFGWDEQYHDEIVFGLNPKFNLGVFEVEFPPAVRLKQGE